MANTKNQSSARRFLQLLWDNRMDGTRWSYERLNHGMRSALHIAIDVGMKFQADDFSRIFADFRGHYWFHTDNDHSQGEQFYAAAVKAGNLSACQSFERWVKREPFIYEGQRLHHGAEVRWSGEWCTVTSFSDDGACVVLCSYKPHTDDDARNYYPRKIKKRFKVTLAELRAIENEKRKAKKAAKKAEGEAK